MPNRDRVLLLQARLTDRDLHLLDWLADHQVLTTPQIANALFTSLGFAQRRLLALHRAGVLERFRPLRPGGGAYPWHYVLAQTGAELVAAARDQPPPRPSETAQRIRRIATSRTLDHRLGVNQFFTDLAAHARTHPPARLERWWSEGRCAAPGAFGASLVSPIRPDGHGIYSEPTDGGTDSTDGQLRRVAFFLEHDTGTESHAVLLDKLTRYDAHASRGGPVWPVLFWLPNPTREHHLHAQLSSLEVAVPLATATRTRDDGQDDRTPAGPIWRVHRAGPQRSRLVDIGNAAASSPR
jgi:hypothetical protein